MKAIEKIRKLSATSNEDFLSNKPVEYSEIRKLLEMFPLSTAPYLGYFDVPIESICASTHFNFAYKNTSWKDMLHPSTVDGITREGINGRNWENDVFKYFLSDLKDANFPTTDSIGDSSISKLWKSYYYYEWCT